MKIAILSDIHSNLEALQACCRKAQILGVEQYICLGDIIGYCADPVATLELVMNLPGIVAVCGNHDKAVLSADFPNARESVQQAIVWTRRQLSEKHTDFIRSLPYSLHLQNIACAHASLYNPEQWQYLYQPDQVRQCMDATQAKITFLGHTHLPILYYDNAMSRIKLMTPQEGVPVPIYQQRRYVANVGSVGQPRDGNSAASFVVYDSELAEITFYRVAYDFTKTAKKILKADLAPDFAKRLADSAWEF